MNSTQIILSSRELFPLWYSTIKEYAISYDIWTFCDPDTSNEPPTDSVKAEALRKLGDRINSTISLEFRVYILNQFTPRDKLTQLRQNIQLTSEDQASQLRNEFDLLRKGQQRRTSLETYLSKWLHLSHKASSLNISNLDEESLCNAFINASAETNSIFYGQMKARKLHQQHIITLIKKSMEIQGKIVTFLRTTTFNEDQIQFVDTVAGEISQLQTTYKIDDLKMLECVALYRETYPYTHSSKRTLNAAFGASLGKEKISSENEDEKDTKRQKKDKKPLLCVCDFNHQYIKCWYLNASAAPDHWEPRDDTVAKIVAKVEGNLKLRQKIEAILTSKKLSLPDFWPKSSANAVSTSIHACYMTQQDKQDKDDSFKLDSAATLHITNDKKQLMNFRTTSESVYFGNTMGKLRGFGDLTLQVYTTNQQKRTIKIRNVAYIPGFHFNIISTQRLEDSGLFFEPRRLCLTNSNGLPLYHIEKHHDFYILEAGKHTHHAFATSTTKQPISKTSLETWHQRLGHIRREALLHLPTATTGAELSSTSLTICRPCELSQNRQHISRTPIERGLYPFERLHFDLVHLEEAFNTDRYLLHFYDLFSGYHISYTLSDRSEKEFIETTEDVITITKQWGYTVRIIQSDGEKALGQKWENTIKSYGIRFQASPPYTASQNGPAERSGGVIVQMARKIHVSSGLPVSLWPEFVQQAVRLLNRLPIRRREWQTPHTIVHHHKPDISGYRIIGSKAYVLIQPSQRVRLHKIRENSIEGYLVGMAASNIYRVWIPQLQRITVVSRDVRIDETTRYDPKLAYPRPPHADELTTILNELDVSDHTIRQAMMEDISNPAAADTNLPAEAPHPPPHGSKTQPAKTQPAEAVEVDDVQRDTPLVAPISPTAPIPPIAPAIPNQPSPNNLISTTNKARELELKNLIKTRTGRVVKPTYKAAQNRFQRHQNTLGRLDKHSNTLSAFATSNKRRHRSELPPPPDHWGHLFKHIDRIGFKLAAAEEINQLETKKTFDVVDTSSLPPNQEVIPLRWVFTYKFDPAGYLTRFKARICVRGDLQMDPGDDLYAATGTYRTLRILIALIAAFGLLCHSADVSNAFTNADLIKMVHVECPQGFKQLGKVWKLNKALYGLKISPKLWFDELSKFLISLGYESCSDEPCLVINHQNGIMIFFYVDDFLLIGPPSKLQEIKQLKLSLHNRYGIKDLGPTSTFLNISIQRDESQHTLWFSQKAYINKLINDFQLQAMLATPIHTPFTPGFKPQPNKNQATQAEKMAYQRRTGSILYASVVSRPDVAFAASLLCQFNSNPSPEHRREADRVLGYLAQTKDLAIQFSRSHASAGATESATLQIFSDASFADDLTSRKSSQGFIICLFHGPIGWQATRQKTVTTSTTEAELLALSHAARESIALWRLFKQIHFTIDRMALPVVFCDNQQTIGLIQKSQPQLTTKLRHVDIHHHWLRQAHSEGVVQIDWTKTADMVADGLTKALPRIKHAGFINQLGMVKPPSPDSIEAEDKTQIG